MPCRLTPQNREGTGDSATGQCPGDGRNDSKHHFSCLDDLKLKIDEMSFWFWL
jgi:hypothetical protein